MEYEDILRCLKRPKYTAHAVKEMLSEEFGEISEAEVVQAVTNGKIIEEYPHDRPVPSYLIMGYTKKGRPLHVVGAPLLEEETFVVITTCQPDPEKWENFERRRS